MTYKLAFGETCTFSLCIFLLCTDHAVHIPRRAQTILAPIVQNLFQEAHFMPSFLIMQTKPLFSFSGGNGVYFMFCSWTFVEHAQFDISCIATPQQCTSVLQNSWQNNYVRVGPVSEAVLTAIVFVSMIANRPMEMAIIVSDPQKKRGTRSTDLSLTRDGTGLSVENQARSVTVYVMYCTETWSLRRLAPQASSEQMLGRDCKN
jgi:hypothetical protein